MEAEKSVRLLLTKSPRETFDAEFVAYDLQASLLSFCPIPSTAPAVQNEYTNYILSFCTSAKPIAAPFPRVR